MLALGVAELSAGPAGCFLRLLESGERLGQLGADLRDALFQLLLVVGRGLEVVLGLGQLGRRLVQPRAQLFGASGASVCGR